SLSEAGLAPLGLTADVASARLRAGRPPVVARIEQGRLLFDPRTVLPGQEGAFLTALRVALGT
ncbi:MAG: L-seryl-tRNA(Sec) selenium transferase, partial [Chloroflexota bacterium]